MGLNLIDLTPPAPDHRAQASLIAHAVDKGVDAIIVGGAIPNALKEALDGAKQMSIPVVAADTRIDHPAVAAFTATDNALGGSLAGNYIVERTGARGSVLIICGTQGHPKGEARRDGMEIAARNAEMPVIFHYAD